MADTVNDTLGPDALEIMSDALAVISAAGRTLTSSDLCMLAFYSAEMADLTRPGRSPVEEPNDPERWDDLLLIADALGLSPRSREVRALADRRFGEIARMHLAAPTVAGKQTQH